MMVRAVCVALDGTITKVIVGLPEKLTLNVADGENLFQITEDDGSFIDDTFLAVDETGVIVAREDAPPGVFVPGAELELVE